jgi:hypothetical protein
MLMWLYVFIIGTVSGYITVKNSISFQRRENVVVYVKQNGASPKSPVEQVSNEFSTLNRIFIISSAVLSANMVISPSIVEADIQIPTKGFQTKSGLKCFDIREGIGENPRYGQMISFLFAIYYKPSPDKPLELIDESQSKPFLHKHGNGRVVRGVDEALHTMKPGGQRRIIVPKRLGYTDSGLGPLPNKPGRRKRLGEILDFLDKDQGQLVFDLQLVYVGDDENDQGYYDDIAISQEEIRELAVKSLKKRGNRVNDALDDLGKKGESVPFQGM